MFHRCSKTFLTVLNRLPRLLDLRQRTDPVIVFRNVRIVNGAVMLRHFQGAVSHKPPKAPSFSSGEIQRWPAGPLWSFQLGRFAGGEENEIFPSCVSFSLLPFFWTSKRKEDHPLTLFLDLRTRLPLRRAFGSKRTPTNGRRYARGAAGQYSNCHSA